MARREFKGNAVPTRLLAGIGAADTSFSINANSGWPTGGANGPFTVIFEPDVPGKEECVLVTDQSGGVCTGVTRGFGDTSPTTHGIGTDGSVIHGACKVDFDDANRHIFNTSDDNHTQYLNLARHAAVLHTQAMMGVDSVGAAQIIANSIGTSELADNSVDSAAIVDLNVITSKLANLGVTTGKIADLNVTTAKIADLNVTAGKIANGAVANDAALLGTNQQLIYVQNTNPGAVGAGKIWYNTAANKRAQLQRNAANTDWEVLDGIDWIPYTPTYPGMAAVGNAIHFARYIRKGGAIIIHGFFRIGNTTSFVGMTNLAISLPTNAQAKDLDTFVNYPTNSSAEFYGHGAARGFINASGGTFGAVGIVTQAGAAKALDRVHFFATGGTGSWAQTVPGNWNTNDRFSYFITYEPGTLVDANYV